MGRIRSTGTALGVVGALGALGVLYWRRNPRVGSGFVNAAVNPGLLRRGLVGSGRSELGTLEHVGRRTGLRRLTPVHPEITPSGFRIIAPLGLQSEWVRNVQAAGHCRLQLHDVVYELDEPTLVHPHQIEDIPPILRSIEAALGFRYLLLRQFAAAPGSLAGTEVVRPPAGSVDADQAPATATSEPAVSAT